MNAVPQKAKGPAEAATSPDHGSTNTPPNEMIMNGTEDSTAAAGQAIHDIEAGLHDLRNMADITAELLEDAIAGSHEHVTGHRDKYHLTERQRDRLMFSAYQTERMARDLIKAFEREGEA